MEDLIDRGFNILVLNGVYPGVFEREFGLPEALLQRAWLRVVRGIARDVEKEFWRLIYLEIDTQARNRVVA